MATRPLSPAFRERALDVARRKRERAAAELAPFAIMQEPGPRATRARSIGTYVRPKRVGTVTAAGPRAALAQYVAEKYPAGHRQFRGVIYESALLDESYIAGHRPWAPDTGADAPNLDYMAHVLLRSGGTHTIKLRAWKEES